MKKLKAPLIVIATGFLISACYIGSIFFARHFNLADGEVAALFFANIAMTVVFIFACIDIITSK